MVPAINLIIITDSYKMDTVNTRLHQLTNIKSTSETFAEIKKTILLVDSSFDISKTENAFNDIINLFNGNYPGYRASNTKYHNLEHTCAVTLATARLIHGLYVQGQTFSPRVVQLGLMGALFHDTGLIQTEDEHEGTGAQYTIGHEDRSISLMEEYLTEKNFPSEDILECSRIIDSTRLSVPIDEIPFMSEETKLMGKVLGSADLIAQMADRNYLEKLPLLFLEFKEAGMEGFETPLELFNKTEEFYHMVARARLAEDLSSVSSAALYHFQNRWNIDRDLYDVAIRNNIKYIKEATESCTGSYESLMSKLRRGV